jgi:type IV secretory pathway TraG/TraD family ATPase VirD4
MKKPAFAGSLTGLVVGCMISRALGHSVEDNVGGPLTLICVVTGAVTGSLLARGLLGGMSGFWESTVGRFLIGRMAGGAVYTLLTVLLWKPAKYAIVYVIAGLVYLIGWQAFPAIVAVFPWALKGVVLGGAWYLRTPAKVFIGKSSAPLRREYRKIRMGQGGSAAFAGICEEWAHRWRPGMFYLGRSLFDRHWPVGIKDDRMVTVLAGTGGGKDFTSVTPNMLSYSGGSIFCFDVKGQQAAITARAQREKGQDVYILDPMSKDTARFNPLAEIDPEAIDYVEQIMGIVDDLVIANDEKNRVWAEWSKIVIAGLIDLDLRRDRSGQEAFEELEESEDE